MRNRKKLWLVTAVFVIGAILVLLTPAVFRYMRGGADQGDANGRLEQEGIAPFALSEREKYILQMFGMDHTAQVLVFQAPKEAISLRVKAYRLENGIWRETDSGGISIGKEREPIDRLEGDFAMQLKENYAMELHISCGGLASYHTNEILMDEKPTASTVSFLQEFQEIQLDREIPVALMVYDSGTTMKAYDLPDYFDPSRMAGMDLVQAVTLEFTDSEEI